MIRINCVSNIAWSFDETESVFELLKEFRISQIEIAPLEIIESWENPNFDNIDNFIKLLNKYKLRVKSIQSIFYKHPKIDLTVDIDKGISHLTNSIEIISVFNCKYIVIGCPNLRYTYIGKESTNNFSKIFDNFIDYNFGIEVAPRQYGGRFLTNYKEVNNFINEYNKENLFIHYDTACNYLSKSEVVFNLDTIDKKKITNIHISSPFLAEPREMSFYDRSCLEKVYDNQIVSLEMKKNEGCNLERIKRVLGLYNGR